jgi:Bacterial archaeo-eukaryotic release factor family 10
VIAHAVGSVNARLVHEVLGLSDSLGVLSVYLGARDAATPGNVAMQELEVELGRIGRLVDRSWTTDPRLAHAALSDIEQHVRGAARSGEARDLALFAPLGRGELVVLAPGGTLPTRATLGSRADVRPLLLALEEARPAGVALLSADGVRVLEWTPGSLADVWSVALPELEERDLVGPAHAHPRGQPGSAPGFKVAQQRDLFERRIRSELEKLLVDAGRKIAELASEHDWRELALAGDDRLTAALARGLPSGTSAEIAPIPHLEQWRTPGELARLVTPAIAGARERRATSLVRRVLDDVGGRGVLGVSETLAALAEARVDTLLVAADRPVVGRSSPSGILAAPGEVPAGTRAAELVDDPMLADAMIGRAHDTGATVVVLPPSPAQHLGDDAVAALLRY